MKTKAVSFVSLFAVTALALGGCDQMPLGDPFAPIPPGAAGSGAAGAAGKTGVVDATDTTGAAGIPAGAGTTGAAGIPAAAGTTGGAGIPAAAGAGGAGIPAAAGAGGVAGIPAAAGAGGVPAVTAAAGTTGAAGAAGTTGAEPFVALPGVTPAPYIDVKKDRAKCSDPLGTPHAPATAGETASLLVGKWRICDRGTFITPVSDHHAGIQFARNRAWRLLDDDGKGTLVPANGFGSTGSWYIGAEDPNEMISGIGAISLVRIFPTGRSGASGYGVELLQGPTRLRLSTGEELVWEGE